MVEKTESGSINNLRSYKLSDKQFRLLGLLPLIFFLAQAIHYWQINQLGHMLWMCNIGNLLLALGIFFEQALLIRVAVIWGMPGVVVWCLYVVPTWGMLITGEASGSEFYGVLASTLAHVGGLSVGILVLRKVRMNGGAWAYSFLWYFIVQLASRLFTPIAFNVNLSQRVQEGWEGMFTSYWKFWLVLSALVGCGSWLLDLLLKRLWPAPSTT
ncbi:MAG TPA: hypothetical protein VE056_11715 [Pyrinomonadaceae bacterium]|nr:hypothetical protein [Pyrinomonadaceae bacterium]